MPRPVDEPGLEAVELATNDLGGREEGDQGSLVGVGVRLKRCVEDAERRDVVAGAEELAGEDPHELMDVVAEALLTFGGEEALFHTDNPSCRVYQ